jgi:hypothetical protein
MCLGSLDSGAQCDRANDTWTKTHSSTQYLHSLFSLITPDPACLFCVGLPGQWPTMKQIWQSKSPYQIKEYHNSIVT